ncbi:MAG: iron-sulfur cluster repair di-iron protein [Myxococcales bacterium]|nr:iron-sulfur cluster repair di-iron protein [Myxococcales bacterium]
MLKPTSEESLGNMAARIPGASRVFMRHHIDFCCRGKRSLAEACDEHGLDLEFVLGQLESVCDRKSDEVDWRTQNESAIISHIIETYHKPLKEELPRLNAMAEKVASVHLDKDQRLEEIRRVLLGVSEELLAHMEKEERVLFPWIRSGREPLPIAPIRVMLIEHADAGEALERLAELTEGYNPPHEACATWRAFYLGLRQFAEDLQQHVHLENNVLFPKVVHS